MTTNTTNLKIETERDQVYLFDSYDFKSTLAINLSAPLEAWDNGTANGANGNVGRDLMGAGTVEDRSKQKQDLLNLEDLIEKNLKPKYGKILDFLTGPDDDLPDLTGDLGTPPDSTTGVSATGEKSLRKALKEPGFYRGFPLLDPNLTTYFDSANNELKVKKIDPTKPVRYTEEKINNFRNFATGYTGPNADVFTKKKTIKDKNGNDVQVFANRKPEECLGFQPGDVLKDSTNGKYFYVNGGWYFGGESKIYYDILSAQNAEEAMDLAFFGKDYDEPQSDKATRKGNPKRKGDKKYPSVNLQFNEVKD
ncbi:6980_t:CDS:2 [Paraglomus occultum]|uniref:6980_t:CDS:1 n=1 Tax=Paraglomus occultum TaxID=144539 RepID=A0A9N8Z9R1_9GLOM|nr:6980_t:CDS:2 [Paraglomus occultum]